MLEFIQQIVSVNFEIGYSEETIHRAVPSSIKVSKEYLKSVRFFEEQNNFCQ